MLHHIKYDTTRLDSNSKRNHFSFASIVIQLSYLTSPSERYLRSFTTDTAGQLDVLRHNGHSLRVDGAKICVLEEADKVSFGGFLKGEDCGRLEAEIGLEVLGNLTDKALEWQLADEELSGLLVASDLTKSDGSRSVSVGLLDTSGGRGGFAGSLGGELLARSLSSGGLACGLLGTGHSDLVNMRDIVILRSITSIHCFALCC